MKRLVDYTPSPSPPRDRRASRSPASSRGSETPPLVIDEDFTSVTDAAINPLVPYDAEPIFSSASADLSASPPSAVKEDLDVHQSKFKNESVDSSPVYEELALIEKKVKFEYFSKEDYIIPDPALPGRPKFNKRLERNSHLLLDPRFSAELPVHFSSL